MIVLVAVTGLVAGFINTLAAGGSNLTIPALMIMGLPADIANATNRVGVMMQSVGGLKGFHALGRLPRDDLPAILLPTIIGSVIGSALVVVLSAELLKPLLLITMISLTIIMLVRPHDLNHAHGTEALRVTESRTAPWLLFFAGVYGGFVQAGVGFVLIAALAGALRYDLVSATAIRLACTLVFTAVALVIFIIDDLVMWIPGLILGVSSMLGASIGVRVAINVSPKVLRWFLLIMTVCASVAALLS